MKARTANLEELDHLLKTYCDGCFVFSTFKKENGRRSAHRFCINKCTVGLQIQKIGERLTEKE